MDSTSVFQFGSESDWHAGFPSMYPRFSRMLADAGIPPRFFFDRERGAEGSLIGQRSIILDFVGYFTQEEGAVERALHGEIEAGARVLCLASPGNEGDRDTLNQFLRRYDLLRLGERHFRKERFRANGVGASVPRDQLPIVPADIVSATDGLAAGVRKVVFEQPSGVISTSERARPLLLALGNPDRVDLKDFTREPADGDEAVAQTWAPPGAAEPSLVVLGDGTWLLDSMIERADNEQLAQNLIQWLSGGTTGATLAAEAASLIDRIELTAWDVTQRRLARLYGPRWPELVANHLPLKERLQSGPNSADDEVDRLVRSGLYLRDKISIMERTEDLHDLYFAGSTSKTKAKKRWGKLNDLRNRVAHADRRAREPVTDTDMTTLRELDVAVSALWRAELVLSVLDAPPSDRSVD